METFQKAIAKAEATYGLARTSKVGNEDAVAMHQQQLIEFVQPFSSMFNDFQH